MTNMIINIMNMINMINMMKIITMIINPNYKKSISVMSYNNKYINYKIKLIN